MLQPIIDWFDANLVTIFNGLAIGLLLFVISVGLSLVFGLMDVLNLAHGALTVLGAYLALSLVKSSVSLVMVIVLAMVIGCLAGSALAVITRPLERRGHLDQALVTLGVSFIVADVVSAKWGDGFNRISPPPPFNKSVDLFGQIYPSYRLLVIGFGVVVTMAVFALFERTRAGAVVRASVADREMVAALGIPVRWVLVGVFSLGVGLAVVGGVVGAPVLGARPGLDSRVLVLALIVVVIGGLGSLKGTLVGALLVGQVDTLGAALAPEYASFLLFGVMAAVLAVRPGGLFGSPAQLAVR